MTICVEPIAALESNYIWLVHDERHALLVDPGCPEAALDALETHKLTLVGILITHHHHDHIGGVDALLERYPVPVWGPEDERIGQVSHTVVEGDHIVIEPLSLDFMVIATPGHTKTHVIYANETMIFAGDTLFSVGCGRLFEGTPAQMQTAMDKISQLNHDALVYCGHEYTEANCRFATLVDPANPHLRARTEQVAILRQHNKPTVPSVLYEELLVNPFLRTREPAIAMAARQHDPKCGNTASEVFATLRAWKDHTA